MIQLNAVKPAPIQQHFLDNSEIWATDLVFEASKKYLISAASGKGKSTLLHILYGLRTDYTGTVNIQQKEVRQFSLEDWAILRQQRLSIVFQNLRLFPTLSGLDNILLKSRLTATSSLEEQKTRIESMATRLGVASILQQPCGTMSYGQQQRIAIIRALQQPFDFLLLDEPFSHLDEDNIKIASTLIQAELSAQKAGLVLVSLGDKYYFEYDQVLSL